MFRRSNSRDSSLSAYMAGRFASVEEEDEESEEELPSVSQDYRRPQLDPISEGVCIKFIYFFNISMYCMWCYEYLLLHVSCIYNSSVNEGERKEGCLMIIF